jgi:regulatory protein
MARAADPLELAYAYLERRERTVAEVRAKLERAGFEADDRERALAELCELGTLDDGRYARLFAQDKRTLEEWGNDRIRRTLLARGIERELVDEALAGDAGESELERAVTLLRRRFPDPPRERRDRERAFGVLVRKGFDAELAADALARHGRAEDAAA